jgi:hypothetical protein
MARQQTEIAGTERPTVVELDDVIGDWLDAKDAAAEAREAVKKAREAATDAMREHAERLERDGNDNPVYVYRDDYRELAVKLIRSSKLGTAVLKDGDED